MTNGCDCNGPCLMPAWVVQGQYPNDPDGQARAAQHWHHMRRVGWTTPSEREGVRTYRAGVTYPCVGGCGLVFASSGTLCYWCYRRGFDALRLAMETDNGNRPAIDARR